MRNVIEKKKDWRPNIYWTKYGFSYVRLDELSTEGAGMLKEWLKTNDLFMPDVTVEGVYDAVFSWDFECWMSEVSREETRRN